MDSQSSFLEVKFSKPDRVYKPNEKVSGNVVVNAKGGWTHRGIDLKTDGVVYLRFTRPGSFGVDENMAKAIVIFNHSFQVISPGKCKEGLNEFPFEFFLKNQIDGNNNQQQEQDQGKVDNFGNNLSSNNNSNYNNNFFESYHGVYISVVYTIQLNCDRGMMKKSLHSEAEYYVEIPSSSAAAAATDGNRFHHHHHHSSEKSLSIPFDITLETLENITPSMRKVLPQFHFVGELYSSIFPIQYPLKGEIIVKFISVTSSLRSVELQLVRIETIIPIDSKSINNHITSSSSSMIISGVGMIKEASEIQNIQIIDGNVCRDLAVPIYMIFPRLYTCPTVITTHFKVEFELNVIIVFAEGYSVTKNFPIVISRN